MQKKLELHTEMNAQFNGKCLKSKVEHFFSR